MDVSKNIRTIRESKNLTQVDVAGKLGTERSNYARLENRGENLTIKQIQDIAEALEVSIYDIIGQPENTTSDNNQLEKIKQLEEKLKSTEEMLKDKKRNIKLYKSFIEWIRDKYQAQLIYSAIYTMEKIGLREDKSFTDEDVNLEIYNLSEDEYKLLGDTMLDYEDTGYLVNNFVAESGFITEKWYIDAYKRMSRKRKEKISYAETKNWVNQVFEFLEAEE